MNIKKISKAVSIFVKKAQEIGITRELDPQIAKIQDAIKNQSIAQTFIDKVYNTESLYNEFISAVQSTGGNFSFTVNYNNGNYDIIFKGYSLSPSLQKALTNHLISSFPRTNAEGKFSSEITWSLL